MAGHPLIEMANSVAGNLLKRSLSQALARPNMEVSHSALLNKLGLSWLSPQAAGFYVNSNQIEVLTEPKDFYSTLIEKCLKARHRIILTALYLGTTDLEVNLVSKIRQRLSEQSGLKVTVLLDALRGSRGVINSRTVLLPLLQESSQNCQISFYQTPALRGPLFLLPRRYKEIVGLQHMKVYLFDNDVVISGANLSKDYFTQRQDRYLVISNAPHLADWIEGLVGRVCDVGRPLGADDVLGVGRVPPGGLEAARKHVWGYYEGFLGKQIGDPNCDSIIFPLLEMGPLNIHQDSAVTRQVLRRTEKPDKVHLATGYFNLTSGYTETLLGETGAEVEVLMSHPEANGFHRAKGPAYGIPHGYTVLATQFLRAVARAKQQWRLRLWEYRRQGWTYHAKGLWLESPLGCHLTLVGSPNFGERSIHHDLECQFLLATTEPSLQKKLAAERDALYARSTAFTEETVALAERQPPLWVRLVVLLFRTYL